MVTHVLAFSLPVLVTVVGVINYSFFSWHPISMVASFAFLMTEAVHIFSPSSSLISSAPRTTKINYHGYLLFCALLSALGGFAVIYVNKNAMGKEHFTSWHGFLGVVTVGYLCLQVPAGIALRYATTLKLNKLISLREMKFYHSVSGCFLYVLGCLCLGLGFSSSWFTSNTNDYIWGGATVGCILLAMLGLNHLLLLLQARVKVGK